MLFIQYRLIIRQKSTCSTSTKPTVYCYGTFTFPHATINERVFIPFWQVVLAFVAFGFNFVLVSTFEQYIKTTQGLYNLEKYSRQSIAEPLYLSVLLSSSLNRPTPAAFMHRRH